MWQASDDRVRDNIRFSDYTKQNGEEIWQKLSHNSCGCYVDCIESAV